MFTVRVSSRGRSGMFERTVVVQAYLQFDHNVFMYTTLGGVPLHGNTICDVWCVLFIHQPRKQRRGTLQHISNRAIGCHLQQRGQRGFTRGVSMFIWNRHFGFFFRVRFFGYNSPRRIRGLWFCAIKVGLDCVTHHVFRVLNHFIQRTCCRVHRGVCTSTFGLVCYFIVGARQVTPSCGFSHYLVQNLGPGLSGSELCFIRFIRGASCVQQRTVKSYAC